MNFQVTTGSALHQQAAAPANAGVFGRQHPMAQALAYEAFIAQQQRDYEDLNAMRAAEQPASTRDHPADPSSHQQKVQDWSESDALASL